MQQYDWVSAAVAAELVEQPGGIVGGALALVGVAVARRQPKPRVDQPVPEMSGR